jgi:hypothetical protein
MGVYHEAGNVSFFAHGVVSAARDSVVTVMACTGQTVTQAPQPVHASGVMRGVGMRRSHNAKPMAPVSQDSLQLWQKMP